VNFFLNGNPPSIPPMDYVMSLGEMTELDEQYHQLVKEQAWLKGTVIILFDIVLFVLCLLRYSIIANDFPVEFIDDDGAHSDDSGYDTDMEREDEDPPIAPEAPEWVPFEIMRGTTKIPVVWMETALVWWVFWLGMWAVFGDDLSFLMVGLGSWSFLVVTHFGTIYSMALYCSRMITEMTNG
jgi:hypothetical protein